MPAVAMGLATANSQVVTSSIGPGSLLTTRTSGIGASSASASAALAVAFLSVDLDALLLVASGMFVLWLGAAVLSLASVCFTTVNVLMAPSHTLGPSE